VDFRRNNELFEEFKTQYAYIQDNISNYKASRIQSVEKTYRNLISKMLKISHNTDLGASGKTFRGTLRRTRTEFVDRLPKTFGSLMMMMISKLSFLFDSNPCTNWIPFQNFSKCYRITNFEVGNKPSWNAINF
jgi:hypothetical protein